MAKPSKPETYSYQFTDDIKFLQKAVVMHPSEDKFCIIKRAKTDSNRPSTWDLPGGNVLYGEENYQALRREILEETGLTVGFLKAVTFLTYYNPDIPMYYFVFGAIGRATSEEITLSDEHTDFKWVTKDEFLSMDSNYSYQAKRPFNPTSPDFLRDIVYEALNK